MSMQVEACLNSPNNNELDRLSQYRYLAIATIADVTFTLVDVPLRSLTCLYVRLWSLTLINYNNYSICVLYIEKLHYISQENAWRSNGSTCQRKQRATFNVFAGYVRKSIYISTDFQISEGLHRGPEFSPNYTIDYLIDYLMDYIIIT